MKKPTSAVRGRPRKYSGKRPNWTIRLQAKYGDRIRAMAEASGRSISETCEQQIALSLDGPRNDDRDFLAGALAMQGAVLLLAISQGGVSADEYLGDAERLTAIISEFAASQIAKGGA